MMKLVIEGGYSQFKFKSLWRNNFSSRCILRKWIFGAKNDMRKPDDDSEIY